MGDTQIKEVFDPSDMETVSNPYPVYDRLRNLDPVHWNPRGFWFLSRYEDVQACLNDARFSNRPAPFALVHQRNRTRFAAADVANNLMAFMDAPEHPKLRSRIARAFARHLMNFGPELERISRECADRKTLGQPVEFVSEIAIPYASRTIGSLIGLPDHDAGLVASWSEDFFRLFHAIPNAEEFARLNDSLTQFRAYMLDRVAERRRSPQVDLISELVADANSDTGDKEIADNLMLLAADGVGNVQSGLANCLFVLLQQQNLPEEVLGPPKERAAIVDECLRLESPGQYQGRITLETLEIGGKTIRAHSVVLLGLASANRDPEAFEDPDQFRAERRRPQHLAFGSGAHMCLGNVLVRREIAAMFGALFADGKRLRLTSTADDWLARPGHRWLGRMDLISEKAS